MTGYSGNMAREQKRKRRHWKVSEVERLRALWPVWPMADILKAFPGRSRQALTQKASDLGVKRLAVRINAAAMTRAGALNAPRVLRELRAHRIAKRLTATDLAKRLGYHRYSVGLWERGVQYPKPRALFDWAGALGLEICAVAVDSQTQTSVG